jgi:Patatin-like phospholipase
MSRINTPLCITVLPVSGGYFPIQLGIIALLCDNKKSRMFSRPDIVLASSGGNVSAYFSIACDWDKANLYERLCLLKNDAFLTGWSLHSLSLAFFPFTRALFHPGYGFGPLFMHSFTSGALRSAPEVWTGVFHRKTGQHRLFTNRGEGETILKNVNSNPSSLKLGTGLAPVYASGDRQLISEVTLASASVPFLVKPATIDGDEYQDGGAMYASPLTVLSDNIYMCFQENKTVPVHILYISSEPLLYYSSKCSDAKSNTNNLETFCFKEVLHLLDALKYVDIRALISLIARFGADPFNPNVYRTITSGELGSLIESMNLVKTHYAIVLFPTKHIQPAKLSNISTKKMRSMMQNAEKNTGALVWKTECA